MAMRPRETRAGRRPIVLLLLLAAALFGGLVIYITLRYQWKEQPSAGHTNLLGGSLQTGARRLAIIIPYRARQPQLEAMLPITADCLRRSEADASIFIIEQAPGMHFNRGALLNVGALILAGSSYDCLVFHDVDTVCTSAFNIVAYSCPSGRTPLHLTPPGLHPRDDYPDFLGGNIVFTQHQFRTVNGFQHAFWGWGKEDDNMVRRLQLHHMWPPQRPTVPPKEKGYYWRHLAHARVEAVRITNHAFRNKQALANMEPRIHDDNRSGLKETRFQVQLIEPFMNATRIVVELACNTKLTPWCLQTMLMS